VSRPFLSVLVIVAIATGAAAQQAASGNGKDAETIIALERAALDRWGRGDPDGYLALYANDVTYFDPNVERRVDGLDAMTRLLSPIKGQARGKVERTEFIAPVVHRSGDLALLTYNLVSHARTPTGEAFVARWNSTVVYRHANGRWRILHSHWSLTKPQLAAPRAP
jgi:uncharacterized protein (TIGR02246 family)